MVIIPRKLGQRNPKEGGSAMLDNFPICAFTQTNRHFMTPDTRAIYNARLNKLGNASWAYVCQNCFEFFECKIGIDSGWKLEQPEND